MNVASLELCRELYELSGWGWDCEHHWLDGEIFSRMPRQSDAIDETTYAPAYDCGYLLRKLPPEIEPPTDERPLQLSLNPLVFQEKWSASYTFVNEYGIRSLGNFNTESLADTPEDALAKLAIELFKQGILWIL